MECERGKMSLSHSKVIIPSHVNALGAGDSSFQEIVGFHTQKLLFPSSPVQIFRQRYWVSPSPRKPFNLFQRYETEKEQKLNHIKSTIHASLEDLRNKTPYSLEDGRNSRSLSNVLNDMESFRPRNNSRREKYLAARRIYEALMLNAWRKRKEDSAGLAKMIDYLTLELDRHKRNFHLAKVLLQQETKINENAMAKISALNSKLQEKIKISEDLREEKEEFERVIVELEDKLSREKTIRSNTVNELIEARNEQAALEAQLTKEREKIIRLREERASVTERVSTLEVILTDKDNWIERMRKINENQIEKLAVLERTMEEEIAAERNRCEELLSEKTSLIRTISILEKEKNKAKSEISLRLEETEMWESRMVTLEEELRAKEEKHELEMKKAVDVLSETLNERRQLELTNERKGQELQLRVKKFFHDITRLSFSLFSCITYAIWPTETYNSLRN